MTKKSESCTDRTFKEFTVAGMANILNSDDQAWAQQLRIHASSCGFCKRKYQQAGELLDRQKSGLRQP